MKLLFQSTLIVLVIFTVLTTSFVHAAGKGGNPNGKPFRVVNDRIVEIEGTITSLQDQINLLVDRVDTVEQRVIANEDAITILQEHNLALESLIQQSMTGIASVEREIASLKQSNVDLLALIANNSGDIAILQRTIELNEALIIYLNNVILQVQDEITTIESSLLSQINYNFMLIEALQAEVDLINEKLEFKQNLITSACIDGSAIQMIRPDGTVVCENDFYNQLNIVVLAMISLPLRPGSDITLKLPCPDGYNAVNAGVVGVYGWDIGVLAVYPEAEWPHKTYARVQARNLNEFEDSILATATCAKLTR